MLSLQFKACFGKEPSVSNCWWHNFLPVSSCDYFLRSRLSLKYASWAATFRLFPVLDITCIKAFHLFHSMNLDLSQLFSVAVKSYFLSQPGRLGDIR